MSTPTPASHALLAPAPPTSIGIQYRSSGVRLTELRSTNDTSLHHFSCLFREKSGRHPVSLHREIRTTGSGEKNGGKKSGKQTLGFRERICIIPPLTSFYYTDTFFVGTGYLSNTHTQRNTNLTTTHTPTVPSSSVPV